MFLLIFLKLLSIVFIFVHHLLHLPEAEAEDDLIVTILH
jgi:hypothetical protein